MSTVWLVGWSSEGNLILCSLKAASSHALVTLSRWSLRVALAQFFAALFMSVSLQDCSPVVWSKTRSSGVQRGSITMCTNLHRLLSALLDIVVGASPSFCNTVTYMSIALPRGVVWQAGGLIPVHGISGPKCPPPPVRFAPEYGHVSVCVLVEETNGE